MFAAVMTLVILVSAGVLLYQYWSGSLLIDDAQASGGDAAGDAGATPEAMAPTTVRIDHAA
jgi:hypothetical protein